MKRNLHSRWIAWIILSAAGIGLGWMLGWRLATQLSEPITRLTERTLSYAASVLVSRSAISALIGGSVGLLAGLGQWLLWRPRRRRWVLASLAGWALGWAAGPAASDQLSSWLFDLLGWPATRDERYFVTGAVTGALVALVLALALGRWRRAWAVIVAGSIGGAALWPISQWVAAGPTRDLDEYQRWGLAWAAGGLAWGAALAAGLWWWRRSGQQRT